MKKILSGAAVIASGAVLLYLSRHKERDLSYEEEIVESNSDGSEKNYLDEEKIIDVEIYQEEEEEVFTCSRCENEFEECTEDSFVYDRDGNRYCESCADINEQLNSFNTNNSGDTDYDWGCN